MRDKNLFAYTAPGAGFPEFVSVNLVEDGTKVSITVRSKPEGDEPGSQAEIRLALNDYEQMRRRLA